MACGGIDPSNIYLWLSLAGILLGGGLSFLIAPRRRRRITAFAVLLSLAVLSMLASFFLSNFSLQNLNFRLIWLGAFSAVGYAAFLFWRFFGIPVLFLLIIFTSTVWYSFYDWSCAESEAAICSFSKISEGSGFMRIQYETADGITGLDLIEGDYVYSDLDIITVPEYFFILRHNRIYRFYGFKDSPGIRDEALSRYGFIVNAVLRMPGASIAVSTNSMNFVSSVEHLYSFDENEIPAIIKLIE